MADISACIAHDVLLEVIRQEYDRISNTIMEMQIALDRYNQTVLFDVAI